MKTSMCRSPLHLLRPQLPEHPDQTQNRIISLVFIYNPASKVSTVNRLDQELVARGLVDSRTKAASHIDAGRVLVGGSIVTKPAMRVSSEVTLEVAEDPADSFASRAALKLDGALEAIHELDLPDLAVPIDGRRCLDLGASTGGFTDVLLRQGAAEVVALDVGHNQLIERLRHDDRVVVIEGYNARELDVKDLPWRPEVVVADVSFISLTYLLDALATVITDATDLLLMVKPQFEVGRQRLGNGGVVSSPSLRSDSVTQVVAYAANLGLFAHAVVPSGLPGPSGNREFFVWFRRDRPQHRSELTVAHAIHEATHSSESEPAKVYLIAGDRASRVLRQS